MNETSRLSELAQKQLDAYNASSLEDFLECYHPHVEVYNFGETNPSIRGIENMRNQYGELFTKHPTLHAKLVNRTTLSHFCLDHEEVRRGPHADPFYAVAIYELKENLIGRVTFLK